MPRRLLLTRKQRWGLPVLFAVPVLALAGVFGERRAEARSGSAVLDLRVTYPERFRYRQIESLRVTVRNTSGHRLDTVTVAFDTSYMGRFASVHFNPAVRAPYSLPLVTLAPGEARLITVELSGNRYGRHTGRITASTGPDSLVVPVTTIVFP
ncbi:MAG: hypothetical protein NVS1B4_18250 [Gemmatimonadaceae bacterium]